MKKPQNKSFIKYKGIVQYDTIGNLISELKEKMFEAQVKQTVYKKVLMVMIEALENVFKYNEYFYMEERIVKKYPPKINVVWKNGKFTIDCSNPIRKVDVPELLERLETINKLDRTGIREAYKSTITNGEFSEKGGAGLGLIEMAKITDEKFQFSFKKINRQFNYYSLKLNINYS